MEKTESHCQIVWLKAYSTTDLEKLFASLLVEEEKNTIVRNAFWSYMKWIQEFSEEL